MTHGADGPRPGQVDRASLADTTRCPNCARALPGPHCDGCGLDLSGVEGARLMQLSLQAEALLAERDSVLAVLRARAAASRAPGPPPTGSPVPLPPPGPRLPSAPPPVPVPVPMPMPVPRPVRPSLMARVGVQGLLVALGALLVAVAGLVFLVFSWERLTLGGRALVIAAITGAAMGGAAWLRPRLAETAEAIGGIAAVLVLADAWAVQATGLFGTDRWAGSGYAAAAGAVCTAVLLGWGAAGRVRAGSVTAAMVGPASLLLGGVWLTQRLDDDRGFFVAGGLLAASAGALTRRWAPPSWRAERAVLRVVAAGAWLLGVGFVPGMLDQQGRATVALALAAVIAAAQVILGRDTTGWNHVGWSSAAGAAAAVTATPAVYRILQWAELDLRWLLAAVPAVATAGALGVNRVGGTGRPLPALRHRDATRAARLAAAVVTLPAAMTAGLLGVAAVASAREPWRAGPGASLAQVVPGFVSRALFTGAQAWVLVVASGLGLAAFGLLLAVDRGRGPLWSIAAAAALALAALVLPLIPALPIGGVVAILLALAVVAAGLTVQHHDRGLLRRTALTVAVLAGIEAVLLSWTVRSLSVPVTAVGIGGLIVARSVTAARFRPVLAALCVVAAAVDVGAVAGLLGHDLRSRMLAASIGGSALAAALGALPPLRRVDRQERLAGVLAGLAASAAGLPWVVDDQLRRAYTVGSMLVLVTLLLALLALAWRPAQEESPAGPLAPVLAAGLAPVAAVAAAVGVLGRLSTGSSATWQEIDNRSLLAASAMVAVCGLGLGLAGTRAPGDRRRRWAELGAAVPLGLLALQALSVGGLDLAGVNPGQGLDGTATAGRVSWLVLLLLGVGSTAAAIPADRRRLAWLGWALLSLSSAFRLARSNVDLVEAYTVPPALALLAVSGYRLRRDTSRYAWTTVAPGVSLLVLPSVLASASGSPWRPAVLIGLGALALALTRWAGRRHELVLLAAGAAAAGGAGTLRVLRGSSTAYLPAWQDVELWGVPAAVVLLAIGVRLLVVHQRLRSWRPLSPGIALLLLPSLVLALDGLPLWRVALVAVLAGAVVAAGAVRRLQAPVVFGGAVLAVHAIAQLGPWVMRTLADQPRWLSMGIVGALLLGLGATYERRLRELRAARVQLNRLR